MQITRFKVNTTSSLTTPQVDVVMEIGCSLTIGQTLNLKKKQTQSELAVFGESSVEEDDGIRYRHKPDGTEGGNSEEEHQTDTAKEDKELYSV